MKPPSHVALESASDGSSPLDSLVCAHFRLRITHLGPAWEFRLASLSFAYPRGTPSKPTQHEATALPIGSRHVQHVHAVPLIWGVECVDAVDAIPLICLLELLTRDVESHLIETKHVRARQ